MPLQLGLMYDRNMSFGQTLLPLLGVGPLEHDRFQARVVSRTGAFPGLFLALSLCAIPSSLPAEVSTTNAAPGLTLQEFRQRVLEHNESIQVRLLELEVNRRKARAEKGIFEPELFGSYTREANKRENTVQQQEAQLGAQTFDELNNIYQGGLEALIPTGARARLGYTLSDLRNSLQNNPSFFSRGATNGEFQSFFGISLVQPLLKNAWFTATMAGIRLAAVSSDIAFQDYRRQLMVVLSTAEATYWNLFMAQEQVRFFEQSVAVAERILADARSRVEVGKGSDLEVLEAQSGLALRRSKLSQAEQSRQEAVNRLVTFYSENTFDADRHLRAADAPQVKEASESYFNLWRDAFDLNPDYLIQRQKVVQELIRLGYARNQRLPEVNFKVSAGLNGLADTPGGSWDDIETGDFPSWSIGLEFRIPIGGGIKSANELAAAKLRRQEALLALHDLETQLANGIDTALQKMRSARETVRNYAIVTEFNENLLTSAMDRMRLGRLEARKVLEIEADLFEARNSQLEGKISFERALLELELVQGALLKNRHLDLSQRELQDKTCELISQRKLKDENYATFIKELQSRYEENRARPAWLVENPAQNRAREALYRHYGQWTATNPAALKVNSHEQEQPGKTLPEKAETPNQ